MVGDETTEAIGTTARKVAMYASLALSTAEVGMQVWAQRAERAAAESEARARDMQQRLRAERELAATSWRRLRTLEGDPRELGQALASAAVWAPFDSRAARSVAHVQQRLAAAGVHWQPDQHHQRTTDDYAAMMLLLQREEETRQQAGGTTAPVAEAGPSVAEFYATGDPARDLQVQRVSAGLDADEAEQVLHSDGWAALQQSMDKAAASGYSPELLLSHVRRARPLDSTDVSGHARDVGAVLHWRLERHLNTHPEPDTTLTPSAFEALQEFEAQQANARAAEPSTQQRVHAEPGAPVQEQALQQQGAAAPPAVEQSVERLEEPARLREAGSLVARSQFGSTAMLQRKLRIDGAEADRLLEALHARGIVGPREGTLARDVLVSPATLERHLDGAPPAESEVEDTAATPTVGQRESEHDPGSVEPDVVEVDPGEGSSTIYVDSETARDVAEAVENGEHERWADGSEAARLAGQAAPDDLDLGQQEMPEAASGSDGARHPRHRPWMNRLHGHERGDE